MPNRDYSMETNDLDFPTSCINTPIGNESDEKRKSEKVISQDGFWDWQITIGNDRFVAKHFLVNYGGCCYYKLIKNGNAIIEMHPGYAVSYPNEGLWNIEGKSVWELNGFTNVIVVDGVDYNQKYQLDGSYLPYEIKGKLIYMVKKNGTYHIVYDDKIVGPEFDDIQISYCCSLASVFYGSGQYWFLGRRAGTKYVVSIQ